ncbi:MAG: hypothetical protein WBK42_01735 [Dethiobacteria bacterium]|jgi:seryl-tRNA synthetase|nr:hypothetical protein [Tepidanaerobacteraceae bacterium]
MASNADRFLKAVEDAEVLTETIKKLQEEITSYQAAGQNLDSVRKDLNKQLQTAYKISENMSGLIKTIAAFGPEIIANQKEHANQISSLNEKTTNEIITLRQNLDKIRLLIVFSIVVSAVAAVISLITLFV